MDEHACISQYILHLNISTVITLDLSPKTIMYYLPQNASAKFPPVRS